MLYFNGIRSMRGINRYKKNNNNGEKMCACNLAKMRMRMMSSHHHTHDFANQDVMDIVPFILICTCRDIEVTPVSGVHEAKSGLGSTLPAPTILPSAIHTPELDHEAVSESAPTSISSS